MVLVGATWVIFLIVALVAAGALGVLPALAETIALRKLPLTVVVVSRLIARVAAPEAIVVWIAVVPICHEILFSM
jgi:hypothetical protein